MRGEEEEEEEEEEQVQYVPLNDKAAVNHEPFVQADETLNVEMRVDAVVVRADVHRAKQTLETVLYHS
jgi:hypothetical protein